MQRQRTTRKLCVLNFSLMSLAALIATLKVHLVSMSNIHYKDFQGSLDAPKDTNTCCVCRQVEGGRRNSFLPTFGTILQSGQYLVQEWPLLCVSATLSDTFCNPYMCFDVEKSSSR